jgi:hypothetical protein
MMLAFILNLTSKAEGAIMKKVFGPMNFKAHLRETCEIYRKNFSSLIAIAAIGEAPIFLMGSIGGKIESTDVSIAVGFLFLCCVIVAGPLMIGALIHAVSEQFFWQTINIGLSYYFAWKRLSTLIGSTILVILAFGGIAIITLGLAVAISFLLGSMGINIGYIIPVILMFLVFYFIISGAFVWEVALLEGLSSKAAVSRSYTLVKKNWWWISGRMFVLGIIISLVNAILGRIPGIGEIIGSILSTPFLVIGHILIYYDLRLRKEGYSVETLSEELNIKSDLKITKVWEDLSNEASTFYEQGKFPEADRRLQEALKAAEFALGPEHLEVSKILRNLAELFEAQGKYTEAEPLYKRVLNIREKALGPDHPDVANICENMGKCYRNMGKKGEAAKLEVRARQIRSK